MENWKIEYNGFKPEKEGLREALCTLGNGHFATRGAGEESNAEMGHYPGTYLAGGYNRLVSVVAGKTIENEDLVNWPNWLPLTFRVENEEHWFRLEEAELISYRKTLYMQEGTLDREVQFKDYKGREFHLFSRRFVSMDNPHLAAISWTLKPINWSGKIEIRSMLDGSVKNSGVDRYKGLNNKHLDVIDMGPNDESGVCLLVQTNQSRIYMAQAARFQIWKDGNPASVELKQKFEEERAIEEATIEVTQEKEVTVEKVVALFTSRDFAITEPLIEACNLVKRAGNFESLRGKHREAWERIWHRFDLAAEIAGNTQMLARLHLFHLLQTCSMHTIGRDVGVPARGWHGEAYRGHIFWDEIFIFPLLNLRMPDLTRSLLLYRYNRLNAARKLAAEAGYHGAMFPWQSGSNGREESQVVHQNPKSGEWVPDNTYLQRHVNLAIAYNIWQYYEATEDTLFMRFYGTEMLLEIARFFADLASWNESKKKFEIKKVVGPDEFHTAYPGSKEPGIDNNAYTNVLTSWLFGHALKALDLMNSYRREELLQKLELTEMELQQWEKISKNLFIPFLGDGIIAQFEGYDKLKELNWEAYRKKYENIQRLDRILDAEGDSVNNYKASKQADVLMLFYLFSAEELTNLFTTLGYGFDSAQIPNTINYYLERTSDGSTLSRIVRSWIEVRSDREYSYACFRSALLSDFNDVQGGTTPEGIHLGSMAGTVDIIQRCFTGLEIRNDTLWLNPRLPNEVSLLKFRVYYRGTWLNIEIRKDEYRVRLEDGANKEITVGTKEQTYVLKDDEEQVFNLEPHSAETST